MKDIAKIIEEILLSMEKLINSIKKLLKKIKEYCYLNKGKNKIYNLII